MPTLLSRQSLRDDLAYVDEQLRRLTDPYDTLRLMWQQRYDQLRRELSEVEGSIASHAEVALLFEGAPVHASEEIRLAFATKMLDQYQSFVGTIAAEKGGAIVAAKGQLPGAFTSKLFIKDMLRGSVGFLLQEPAPAQKSIRRSDALDDLASGNDEQFQARVDSLSPRAVNAVKKIVKTLREADAEVKIVGTDAEIKLDKGKVAGLNARLNELEVLETYEEMPGTLLGILPDRRQYEFRIGADGPVVYGPVSEDLDENYMTNPDFAASILLKPVVARFLLITKVRGGQTQNQQRVLDHVELERPQQAGDF